MASGTPFLCVGSGEPLPGDELSLQVAGSAFQKNLFALYRDEDEQTTGSIDPCSIMPVGASELEFQSPRRAADSGREAREERQGVP